MKLMCEHTYDFLFSTDVSLRPGKAQDPLLRLPVCGLTEKETTLLYSRSRKKIRGRVKPDLLKCLADKEELAQTRNWTA
jgi:hypothetical protein